MVRVLALQQLQPPPGLPRKDPLHEKLVHRREGALLRQGSMLPTKTNNIKENTTSQYAN
jgi:hypothetical protein